MADSINSPGDYRIEVSGWGLDDNFFVEKTALLWAPGSEKTVQLHRALPEGAVVFIRLMAVESPSPSFPVAYRIDGIEPMDCSGCCEMKLRQIHPRSKESPTGNYASNGLEDLSAASEPTGDTGQLHHEEILQ